MGLIRDGRYSQVILVPAEARVIEVDTAVCVPLINTLRRCRSAWIRLKDRAGLP